MPGPILEYFFLFLESLDFEIKSQFRGCLSIPPPSFSSCNDFKSRFELAPHKMHAPDWPELNLELFLFFLSSVGHYQMAYLPTNTYAEGANDTNSPGLAYYVPIPHFYFPAVYRPPQQQPIIVTTTPPNLLYTSINNQDPLFKPRWILPKLKRNWLLRVVRWPKLSNCCQKGRKAAKNRVWYRNLHPYYFGERREEEKGHKAGGKDHGEEKTD